MGARSNYSLVIIGSGPGIGRHIARHFAENKFSKVALLARNPRKLADDQAAVEAVAPGQVTVKTYQVDISDEGQLLAALDRVENDIGLPECVLFNAAVITPTKLFEIEEADMIHDFKVTCTALHSAAKWAIPLLLRLAKTRGAHVRPSLLVTSSLLPQDPIPELFLLSMVKAAQKNMVLSLSKTYTPQGVHVGLVTIGGAVDESNRTLNPANIALEAWEFYDRSREQQGVEVQIL